MTPKGITRAEKRASILRMRDATLAELIRTKPSVRDLIDQSPGYAVFSNVRTNVIYAGAGAGYGVVVDQASGLQTFMKMAQLGVGPIAT